MKQALVVGGVVVVVAVVAVAIAMATSGGGKGTATKAEYQATIVNARDRVDFAYADITKSDSVPNLIERLDTASLRISAVADDLDNAPVAMGFEDLNAQLVTKLEKFSGALAGVADQFEDPSSVGFGLESLTSLGLGEWDEVNAVLTEMQKKGLKVELLERH
jgi:hypothetical protein